MADRAWRPQPSDDESDLPIDGYAPRVEAELIARFERRIRYAARQRVAPEWVEDVVQETLLAVLMAVREGRIRDPEKLTSYVYTTARNVISNWVRGEKRWARGQRTPTSRPETRGADRLLMEKEEAAAVEKCLESLREGDREILRLLYFEGLAPREVAERFGIERNVARQRKWRALKRFREAWREGGNWTATG